MALRRNPIVYEINTAVWLDRLSKRYERPVTLDTIQDEVLDELAAWHFDAVWLMGVWERSPRGREVALAHSGLQTEYNQALPGYTPEHILGSPYAVHRYSVDPRFGGREGLAAFRSRLARRGMKLILDYVPNHVAVDNPWTTEAPGVFVRGDENDLRHAPSDFFRVEASDGNAHIYAHGRDPYFPPWTDTVQIDAFAEEARHKTRETLLDIASQCDGVRCDMVMLMVSRIFAQTWRRITQPQTQFWMEVIPPVKARHPDFMFAAEVYWGMESELQALGFDYTYDKTLYDRMTHDTGRAIRDHLMAPLFYRRRMVLFTENHDEPRALTAFGPRWQAAAVLAATAPGMSLFHEGQFDGRRVKLPVQLGVGPDEGSTPDVTAFYRLLLDEINAEVYHDGVYMILAAHPAPGSYESAPHEHLVNYAWATTDDMRVVAINFSENPMQARLILPRPELIRGTWRFENMLAPGESVLRTGESLLTEGLPVEIPGFGAKIWRAVRT